MIRLRTPIVVDSPVRAVCITPNTPGSRVPSHGTDAYGESYAIDFVVVGEGGTSRKPYSKSVLRYVLKGLELSDFYGWSETVYAPIGGTVIRVVDGVEERNPVRILNDLRNTVEVTRAYEAGLDSQESITGNCVVLDRGDGAFALLAHLRRGSVLVREGQAVTSGQAIGQLGHSGNSTMPHLHMQFMDAADPRVAKGLLFSFRRFYVRRGGAWAAMEDALPTDRDIARFE